MLKLLTEIKTSMKITFSTARFSTVEAAAAIAAEGTVGILSNTHYQRREASNAGAVSGGCGPRMHISPVLASPRPLHPAPAGCAFSLSPPGNPNGLHSSGDVFLILSADLGRMCFCYVPDNYEGDPHPCLCGSSAMVYSVQSISDGEGNTPGPTFALRWRERVMWSQHPPRATP